MTNKVKKRKRREREVRVVGNRSDFAMNVDFEAETEKEWRRKKRE